MNVMLLIPLLLCLTGAGLAFCWRLLLPKLPSRPVGWFLALFPLISFIILVTQTPAKEAAPKSLIVPSLPSLGLNVSL